MILLITLKNQAVWQLAKWNKNIKLIKLIPEYKDAPRSCFPNSGTERLVDGDNDNDDDDSDGDDINLYQQENYVGWQTCFLKCYTVSLHCQTGNCHQKAVRRKRKLRIKLGWNHYSKFHFKLHHNSTWKWKGLYWNDIFFHL